jgi:hypothetical protein
MINKLKLLGEYVHENEGDVNSLGLNLDLVEANVVVLNFSLDDKNCVFLEFDTIERVLKQIFLLLRI